MPRSNSSSYLGNPKLKAAGVEVKLTTEQLAEYLKCSDDPIYFIKKYVRIVNVDQGEIPFLLYDYQEEMINTFIENRFSIIKCGRQIGKSITTCSYLLWLMCFKEQQNIAILANKLKTAMKLLDDLKKSYMSLPLWIQQGVIEWNKGNIELENGCKLMASSTSSDAIRGNAFNLIFLDEFAFVPPHIADEFFDSVYPTISSGNTSKVIIVSTPKGMNKFYKMWTEANRDRNSPDPELQWNGFQAFEIHWRRVPNPNGKGLRDDEWRDTTIRNTSVQQFRQEFECEFIGSSSTLISPECLRNLVAKTPRWNLNMRYSAFPDGTEDLLDVFEQPKPGHQYVLCADVAGGKELDYSAFIVFDVTSMPYKVVAKYTSNKISTMLYPDVINQGAAKYNMAYVLVETNDNDVAKTLHQDLEYENLIMTTTKGKGTQVGGGFTKNSEFGLRSNKATKRIGCTNLKTLLEASKLLVDDYDIHVELNSFVANERGLFAAEVGANDDLVMCLVNFSWLVNQKYFKDLTDSDIYQRLKSDYDAAQDESIAPFGYIDNGMNNEDTDWGPKL